jgi:hypothetical protein
MVCCCVSCNNSSGAVEGSQSQPPAEPESAKARPQWWRVRSLGPSVIPLSQIGAVFYYQLTQASVAPRRANGSPFRFRFCKRAAHPISKSQLKTRRCCLISTCIERSYARNVDDPLRSRCVWRPATSARLVCNGALRYHSAPATHVAHLHKTLRNRRAFLCFHRRITAGTPNDRRVIHTILHSPSPTAVAA